MLVILAISFTAFPQKDNAILNTPKSSDVKVEASGSLGLYQGGGKCVQTTPNMTILEDRKLDWCSNLGTNDDKPWIQYYFPNKLMKLQSYNVRNGCCYYYCCCFVENGEVRDIGCCCDLYSFSLLGSNDNKTWVTLHKEEKADYSYCSTQSFEIHNHQPFRFIRFSLDSERPGCPKCLQINQIELYGETVMTSPYEEEDIGENDESISIIGKIKHY